MVTGSMLYCQVSFFLINHINRQTTRTIEIRKIPPYDWGGGIHRANALLEKDLAHNFC